MKLSIHEASKLIGVAVSTMRRWESEKVVINYKDRLIRFGYEIIEQLCFINDVDMEIINYSEDKNHEEELVEDVLSVITVFSARLYGSRSHKTKKITGTNKKLFKEELLEEAQ